MILKAKNKVNGWSTRVFNLDEVYSKMDEAALLDRNFLAAIKKSIDKHVASGKMKPREGVKWTDFYENCLKGYTYLKV